MTVLVFTILFGLSFVVFPCEGRISLPPEGDTFVVLPGTNVKIAWKFDDKIEDLVARVWRYTPDKLLATISYDQAVNIKDRSPLPGIEIEKPSTLVLKNVDARYNGKYEFQVVGKTSSSSYVTVFVAVEPTMTVCSTSITVDEDENVTCLCQGKGGQPPANVRWYTNGVQQGDIGDEKNILSLSHVNETAGGTYNCVGQSYTLKAKKSFKVIVRPSVRPIVTVNCSSPVTVNKGDNVKCLCKGEGGNPLANVTWYKDGVQQGVAGKKENMLSLSNVDKANSGTYKCAAQRYVLTDEKSIEIIIYLRPIVTVNCSSPVTVNEGDNVKCLCNGEGGNPPANVTWYKDGVQQGVAGKKENMLSLSNVNKADSGTYKCAAQRYVLTDEKSIEIIIYYAVPPAVTNLTSTPGKAFLGKKVVIICEAIAVPVPSYIIIQNDTAVVSTKKTYIIPVMDYTHAGSYKCIAKNILGSSSKTFSLSVVGLVQKTTVAMAKANSLNKVESVVVWHIVVPFCYLVFS